MPVVIGVLKESARGEKRVALVPDMVKKFTALGADICLERGAGEVIVIVPSGAFSASYTPSIGSSA